MCNKQATDIRKLADEVDEWKFGDNVANVVGSSVGVLGGGLSIAALATFFTFPPVGVPLGLAAMIVGIVGTLTSTTSTVVNTGVEKFKDNKFKEILRYNEKELKNAKTVIASVKKMLNGYQYIIRDEDELMDQINEKMWSEDIKKYIEDLSKVRMCLMLCSINIDLQKNNCTMFDEDIIEDLEDVGNEFEEVIESLEKRTHKPTEKAVGFSGGDTFHHNVNKVRNYTDTGKTLVASGKSIAKLVEENVEPVCNHKFPVCTGPLDNTWSPTYYPFNISLIY